MAILLLLRSRMRKGNEENGWKLCYVLGWLCYILEKKIKMVFKTK